MKEKRKKKDLKGGKNYLGKINITCRYGIGYPVFTFHYIYSSCYDSYIRNYVKLKLVDASSSAIHNSLRK